MSRSRRNYVKIFKPTPTVPPNVLHCDIQLGRSDFTPTRERSEHHGSSTQGAARSLSTAATIIRCGHTATCGSLKEKRCGQWGAVLKRLHIVGLVKLGHEVVGIQDQQDVAGAGRRVRKIARGDVYQDALIGPPRSDLLRENHRFGGNNTISRRARGPKQPCGGGIGERAVGYIIGEIKSALRVPCQVIYGEIHQRQGYDSVILVGCRKSIVVIQNQQDVSGIGRGILEVGTGHVDESARPREVGGNGLRENHGHAGIRVLENNIISRRAGGPIQLRGRRNRQSASLILILEVGPAFIVVPIEGDG